MSDTFAECNTRKSKHRQRSIDKKKLHLIGLACLPLACASLVTLYCGYHRNNPIQSGSRKGRQSKSKCSTDPKRSNTNEYKRRMKKSYQLRLQAAESYRTAPLVRHPNNGDEEKYKGHWFGNYSKGLPHDSNGDVLPYAYESLLKACETGKPEDFEKIVIGGVQKLVNPQAGWACDCEGVDSHQTFIPPPPTLDSAERAAEAVENYWAALLRDVAFEDFPNEHHPFVRQAIADLNRCQDFRGPRDPHTGKVTGETLFRGLTKGDLIGPYISQFLMHPLQLGANTIDQKSQTYLSLHQGGKDYLTTFHEWLHIQNGDNPKEKNLIDPVRRYIRNGRDIAAWVHVDVLFQAYDGACVYLENIGAPHNPGLPYSKSSNQVGFGTFGAPHFKTLLCEVSTRALKSVWFQKWKIHRCLRPEEFGARVHNTLTASAKHKCKDKHKDKQAQQQAQLHSDILNSPAVEIVHQRNGSYLLPMVFPEGCPYHPSYGAGHATVGGICVTILKFCYDENFVLKNVVYPNHDGTQLLPYTGHHKITVGNELDKLASNIGIGRNIAGVHWRSDYAQSLLLGEAVAISILQEQKHTYNEKWTGVTFTKFDGTSITI